MALSEVTISFDVHALLGADFTDLRRIKAYVVTNVESGTLMDTSTGETRLGDQVVDIAVDGTGSWTTWAPDEDVSNPASWQETLVLDYPRAGQNDRAVRRFGPYTLQDANDGDNITDLDEEQAVPAEYLTTVTDLLQGYVTQGQALLAAMIASSGIDDADTLAATIIEELFAALGPLTFRGGWNASTNTPSLADGTGTTGHFYQVTTGGSRNLGSGSIAFSVGDFVSYDGAVWVRTASPAVVNPVTSAEAGLRMVRGIVNTTSSGTIVEGSGFTLTKGATGIIQINFTVPFSDVPATTPVAVGGGSNLGPIACLRSGFTPTTSAVQVEIQSIGGSYVESVFHFIAVGPA